MTTANRRMMTSAAGVAAGIAVMAGLTFSLVGESTARAQNLGSPPFANPSEVRSRDSEHALRMVMELTSGTYQIPNVGTETLRQFRGWDAAQPAPAPSKDISTGPTLRARLGDRVEIAFLNKIDDTLFPYSFDTNSPPGYSGFGCDSVTDTLAPGFVPGTTGNIYPGNDKFPNCFHGSSTANLHFHGTHAPPDGLGDNVLVQVLPQVKQKEWSSIFTKMFSGPIPQHWSDMPQDYRDEQLKLVKKHDEDAASFAAKNKLTAPAPLLKPDLQMIADGQWPQFLIGAFPNFFEIPDYSTPGSVQRPDKSTGKYMAGQAPGTHWYHAHKHGSTSLHILNGLAGAFIIESTQPDGYDQTIRRYYSWGDRYGDHEKVIVFQQFDPTQNLERIKPAGSATGSGGPPAQGKGSKLVMVNGKMAPTITMAPGEVQLWRLVNATEGNNSGVITKDLFTTPGFTFTQTAEDGVQLSPDNYALQPFIKGLVPGGLTLAGANRADLLVQAPTTGGVYTFVSNKTTRVPAGTTILFVNVTGTAPVPPTPNPPVPPKSQWAPMPAFLKNLPAPGPNDITNPGSPVKFQWEQGRTSTGMNALGFPPRFMINQKQFEETGSTVDQCMPLNGLQDWVLENYSTPLHPFHIHINPFQVVSIQTPTATNTWTTYAPTGDLIWQDVIALPPGFKNADGTFTPSRVTIRQTYLDFTGTYVLHCHILAHEDRGMMQLVRVVPAAMYPKACQNSVPIHH